jgi:protein-S-isoprenylcysteine O-methyltransferase Ste14
MFPVLLLMYVHLARQEERWAEASFGAQWHTYSARVPAFIPHLGNPTAGKEQQP